MHIQNSHTYIRISMILSGLFVSGASASACKCRQFWRNANIATIIAVNSSVEITGYRITFWMMSNRFTSIFNETSWLVFINCVYTLRTINFECIIIISSPICFVSATMLEWPVDQERTMIILCETIARLLIPFLNTYICACRKFPFEWTTTRKF